MLNLGGDALGRFVQAWGCDGIECKGQRAGWREGCAGELRFGGGTGGGGGVSGVLRLFSEWGWTR